MRFGMRFAFLGAALLFAATASADAIDDALEAYRLADIARTECGEMASDCADYKADAITYWQAAMMTGFQCELCTSGFDIAETAMGQADAIVSGPPANHANYYKGLGDSRMALGVSLFPAAPLSAKLAFDQAAGYYATAKGKYNNAGLGYVGAHTIFASICDCGCWEEEEE